MKGLTKIYNLEKNDWDVKTSAILWAYKIAYKRSNGKTPVKMVYFQEVIVPFHYKYQAPQISQALKIELTQAKEQTFFHLQKLEEERLHSIHHQGVQKQQQ